VVIERVVVAVVGVVVVATVVVVRVEAEVAVGTEVVDAARLLPSCETSNGFRYLLSA
jgi:hypothetical protein